MCVCVGVDVCVCVCARCMQSVSPLLVPGSSHAVFPVFQLRQSVHALSAGTAPR